MNAAEIATIQKSLHSGDWRSALIELRKAAAVDPIDHSRLLCCAYLQAGRWDEVSTVAAAAAQRYTQDSIFPECWAWAEHKLGETATALQILESVAPRFRNRESFVYLLACLYAASSRVSEAEHYLARAKRLSPNPQSFFAKATRQRELQILWTRDEMGFAA
jgi:hypothetical protein